MSTRLNICKQISKILLIVLIGFNAVSALSSTKSFFRYSESEANTGHAKGFRENTRLAESLLSTLSNFEEAQENEENSDENNEIPSVNLTQELTYHLVKNTFSQPILRQNSSVSTQKPPLYILFHSWKSFLS